MRIVLLLDIYFGLKIRVGMKLPSQKVKQLNLGA